MGTQTPFSLFKQPPLQRAELDGLQNFVAGDFFFSGEVGQGPGDFQNAVVGAGREVHLLHGVFEVAFAFRIELAAFADLASSHRGIGGELGGFKTLHLDFAGVGDSLADDG